MTKPAGVFVQMIGGLLAISGVTLLGLGLINEGGGGVIWGTATAGIGVWMLSAGRKPAVG